MSSSHKHCVVPPPHKPNGPHQGCFYDEDGKHSWSTCGLCEQGTQTEQGTTTVLAQEEESVKAVSAVTPADVAVQVDVLTNTASIPSPSALVIPASEPAGFLRPPLVAQSLVVASKPPPVNQDEIQSLESGYTDWRKVCLRRLAVRDMLREIDS